MSISLKSIELSNVRSHKHTFFEPANSGITAISGPTGAGKSTIIDSIAWALYGTKPNGVSKASAIYRDGADFKKDKCFARVELYIDQTLFKIERRMVAKGGATECDVWEWENEEWLHRAGTAVSHSEKYIRETLKMDEKGFLTAILIQQKQVDQLISSGPRERAQVIEKLTGISSITEGLVMARQEYNILRKNAQVSTIDESQLQNAVDELEAKQAQLKKFKKDFIERKEQLVSEKEKGAELKKLVTRENEKAEAVSSARTRESQLEAQIEFKESALSEAVEEKDRLKKIVNKSSLGNDFEESKKKLVDLKSEVNKLTVQKTLKAKELESLKNTLETNEEIVTEAEVKEVKKLNREIKKLEENIEELELARVNLRLKNSELKSLSDQYENAAAVLSQGDCPTCLQSVGDSDAAVAMLKEKANLAMDEAKANKEKGQEIVETLKDVTNRLKGFNKTLTALEILDATNAQLEFIEKDLQAIDSDFKTQSAELKAVEKIHKNLERHEENNRAYNTATSKASSLAVEIDSLKKNLKETQSVIKNTGAITMKKLNKLRDELFTLQSDFQEKRIKYETVKTDAQLTSKDIEHLKLDIVRYRNEIEKYTDLLASVEISSATVQILDEFRGERMKTALPTIEGYASELLTHFTDGKFIRLQLDEKFNASVALANGTVRAVGLLSGGELSAASIALRLSVSILLNSSARSMIILDEVLVSQDKDRSELILSTIKDVFQGQIIMISHNASLDGIADKTVELVANL